MSKSKILETIRKNRINSTSLLDVQPHITTKTQSVNKSKDEEQGLLTIFRESLKQVGAEVLEEMPPCDFLDFRKPEVQEEYSVNCPLDKLYKIETILLTGRLGVAENGAIWMEDEDFPNRLLPFVAQQLIICLDKTKLVRNMQEAYAQIHLEETGFGVFISGPSKTADIEQSLVYGAHGAKTLTVVLN